MKKYTVRVNGEKYDVEIEEIRTPGSARGRAASGLWPRQQSYAEAPAAKAGPAPAAAAGSNTITAPMPGTIVEIRVSAGDSVSAGDTLMILEAMKMENEIICPRDGVVAAIHCTKGGYVNTGAALCDVT